MSSFLTKRPSWKREGLFFCSLLTLACACTRSEEPQGALLSSVKAGLSQRDGKLSSYHLAGQTRQEGADAGALEQSFEFFYRAPNRMRGMLRTSATGALERMVSFDGKTLYELVPADKKLMVYENKLPPAKSAEFLTQIFSPFAPEGFRAPLLAAKGATARRGPAPNGPEAVRITSQSAGDGNQLVTTLVLRWPSLDFLWRRLEMGTTTEVRMEEESCDAKLKFCVPTKVTTRTGGNSSVTSLSKVELNVAVPADDFTLTAPAGYALEHHELVESP